MTKVLNVLAVFAAALPLAICTSAEADVSINGFGQFIGGSTLSNSHPLPGYSYEADPSFNQESLFALQVSAPLTPTLSATAQILARGSNDYSPKFAWAYVNWKMTPHWQLKAGRQRLPLFRYSDYLDVGQAYVWIRPPTSVYNLGFSDIDGLSLSGSYDSGKWILQPQLMFGAYNGIADVSGVKSQLALKNHWLISLDATYDDWLSLRASAVQTKLSINSTDLDAVISTLNAAGLSEAASQTDIQDNNAVFLSAGVEINRYNWILSAEATRTSSSKTIAGGNNNYYLALGRHIGKWTPIATVGRSGSKSNAAAAAATPPSAVCPLPVGPGGAMVPVPGGCAILVGAVSAPFEYQRRYYSAGLRYDVSNTVALKLDYTAFSSQLAGTPSANLLTAGVSFTF